MRYVVVCCVLVLTSLSTVGQSHHDEVTTEIKAEPARPLVEHRDHRQLLEFDFGVRNRGTHTLRLREIELSVYDSSGALSIRETVNSDGLRPGIQVVGSGLLRPGEVADIFNPFFSFADEVPLARMDFDFRYLIEDSPDQARQNRHRLPMDFDLEQSVTVTPQDYKARTNLILPLRGRVLCWEGHDFFAHHRRIPLDSEKAIQIGIRGANAERYGSDLVIVNDRGEMYHGDPYHKNNYYVYGQPIYAPGAGIVYASSDDIPDNEFEGRHIRTPKLPPGTDEDLGNFVIIDHGNGEYSVMPHMKPGSVRVKKGDRVQQGEMIGEVGFSGDAIFPHVHYSLVSGPNIYHFEAVPAYFRDVKRIVGSRTLEPVLTTIDSGDLVESSATYGAK